MLAACFSVGLAIIASPAGHAAPVPSVCGVAIGAELTLWRNRVTPNVGSGTPWWFGYRPDVPGAGIPLQLGPTSDPSDDWAPPHLHISFNPPPGGLVDLSPNRLPVPYPQGNQGARWPRFEDSNNPNVQQLPWGGFTGTFVGRAGTLSVVDWPWSSSGADFGVVAATENFWIYDIRDSGSVASPDGWVSFERQSYGQRWDFANPSATHDTFVLEGTWRLKAFGGSFAQVFTQEDIGQAVGTWGLPTKFYPNIRFNDFNFSGHTVPGFPNASNVNKYLVYQFLPAGLRITKTAMSCAGSFRYEVTNLADAEVTLEDILVQDGLATIGTIARLIPGQTATLTPSTVSPQLTPQAAMATARKMVIERPLDVFGSTGRSVVSTLQVKASSAPVGTPACASLAGCVYYDLNGNGMKDSGEPALSNVAILLTGTDVNGNAVRIPGRTDTDGNFSFPNLMAGTYCLEETDPTGFFSTNAQPGTAGGSKINANKICGITLPAGQTGTGYCFGDSQSGKICGVVYCDANRNGIKEGTEVIISGVRIELLNASAQPFVPARSTATNTSGAYCFLNLPPGNYWVNETDPPGVAGDTTPDLRSVTIGAVTMHTINFGEACDTPMRVGDYRTQTQGGWGAIPNGNNPAMLLKNNWSRAFPAGFLQVGSAKILKLTSALAVQNFLPQGGTAGRFATNYTDPGSTSAGVLGGQVTALTISVAMSNAGVIGTRRLPPLSGLKLCVPSSPLNGKTVGEILTLAHQVLGGAALPPGVSLSQLNDAVTKINENFVDGRVNKGCLCLP